MVDRVEKNFVHFSRMQLESQFVSLAKLKVVLGNCKRLACYNWVKA
jgi:hypothetical protein